MLTKEFELKLKNKSVRNLNRFFLYCVWLENKYEISFGWQNLYLNKRITWNLNFQKKRFLLDPHWDQTRFTFSHYQTPPPYPTLGAHHAHMRTFASLLSHEQKATPFPQTSNLQIQSKPVIITCTRCSNSCILFWTRKSLLCNKGLT